MRGPVDLDRDHDAVPLRRGSGTAGRRRARLPTLGGLTPWPGIPRMPPELMLNGRRFLTWLEAWPTAFPATSRRTPFGHAGNRYSCFDRCRVAARRPAARRCLDGSVATRSGEISGREGIRCAICDDGISTSVNRASPAVHMKHSLLPRGLYLWVLHFCPCCGAQSAAAAAQSEAI